MTRDTIPPLAPDAAARLVELARALKAAARAVALYPGGHPSIGATLGKIVQLNAPAHQPSPMRINVLADTLLLDGKALPRPDQAATELAVLLHAHLVGEFTVHAGGDIEGWRRFVQLVGRAPDQVRADGGLARLWTTMAGRHVEVREIDYAEVLREKTGGDAATWDRIMSSCLQGEHDELDEASMRVLAEAAADSERLTALLEALNMRAAAIGQTVEAKTAALVRFIQQVIDSINRTSPDALEGVLRNMAHAVGTLSPEMMASLLSQGGPSVTAGIAEARGDGVGAVVQRMSDDTVATFVARNAIVEGTALDRLAQAFQALVRNGDERHRLLALAQTAARELPAGRADGFDDAWSRLAERLLRSYSDEAFISPAYARELSSARSEAISIEKLADDPPDRIAAWIATVATGELRNLDIALLLDLLRIESDNARWKSLMTPIVALLEDLLLVGDVDAAHTLLVALTSHLDEDAAAERRLAVLTACDTLAAGPMLRHVMGMLPTLDEAGVEKVKALCVGVGEALVEPLAEALSVEERPDTRDRLTAVLLAFGAVGRRHVERLKSSPKAAVRRTAAYLLREFGGTDALPDLTELLDDSEPQVQREAVRSIVNIGNDVAFRVLEQALLTGSDASRDAIMRSLGAVRDERAVPLFAYIVDHVDHRGPLAPIYVRAIEVLGSLKDPGGIPALEGVLYRGAWWAPRRTAALRRTAASALARIGTAEAVAVLDEAARRGSRGVRTAAKQALARTAPARDEQQAV